MIVLNRNTENKNIVVTLTEFTTIQNPTFLFEFINDTTSEKFYVISLDLSAHRERYNLFNITEGFNDVLNGSVKLGAIGFYMYNVYEQQGSSLSPLGLNKVESGKMKLVAPKEVVSEHLQDSEFTVYER